MRPQQTLYNVNLETSVAAILVPRVDLKVRWGMIEAVSNSLFNLNNVRFLLATSVDEL